MSSSVLVFEMRMKIQYTAVLAAVGQVTEAEHALQLRNLFLDP